MDYAAGKMLEWAEDFGWSRARLAREINAAAGRSVASSQSITNWAARRLPPEHYTLIAGLFKRTVEELTGVASAPTHAGSQGSVSIGALDGEDPDAVNIVQYQAGGSMGRGLVLRDQPGVIQAWRVSHEWIHKNVKHATAVSNLCIVTGFGDSMRPLYNPVDPLLVDRGVTSVDFDAIYFFRVGNEGFIKRLQRIPGVGLVALSENKAYKDWTITESMDFEVFGRVLKLWRGEDY